MKLVATLWLSILLSSCVSNAYKVLVVFPLVGTSHSILGEGFVRRLLDAGHEVTYIAGILAKERSPRLRQIDVTANAAILSAQRLDIKTFLNQQTSTFGREVFKKFLLLANSTVMNEDVQKLIQDPKEQFDVIVLDYLFCEIYAGLASVFSCPYIWFPSTGPHGKVLSLINAGPEPGAYAKDIICSGIFSPFTFAQKVTELWKLIKVKFIEWETSLEEAPIYEQAFASAVAKRGRKLASYQDLKYNASFVLGNSHISAGQATSLPLNYAAIAGYHIQDTVKPLPADLQKIMDTAKNGVIYFSMGSMLESRTMPDELKTRLLDMFGGLLYTVIWKIEESPSNVPDNVHVVPFAPQQSILAHPNCILFITHGGLLSTTETLHYGVPIIGIPVYGDQFVNVKRAVHNGFGKIVSFGYDLPVHLKAAIDDIIGNPSYRERVKELSFIYHDRPVSPGKELVHWVEHVVRTGGAPHLRSPALMLPWYQKMYLDLAVVVTLVLYGLIYAFNKLVNKVNILFSNKEKTKGKNKNH